MARPTQQEIEEWERRMAEPEDSEDDFEIEIFSPEGHGARLPYSRGRSYLQQHFGIDIGDAPTGGEQSPATGKPTARTGGKANTANTGDAAIPDPEAEGGSTRISRQYFGRTGTH